MRRKTFMLFLLTSIIMLSLTSCQVNWFNRSYDVPWWAIAVPVTMFSLIVWIVAGKYISKKKYVCPKCGGTFYPKWWKAGISIHVGNDRVFRCPHCGIKGFCHMSQDSKK